MLLVRCLLLRPSTASNHWPCNTLLDGVAVISGKNFKQRGFQLSDSLIVDPVQEGCLSISYSKQHSRKKCVLLCVICH